MSLLFNSMENLSWICQPVLVFSSGVILILKQPSASMKPVTAQGSKCSEDPNILIKVE